MPNRKRTVCEIMNVSVANVYQTFVCHTCTQHCRFVPNGKQRSRMRWECIISSRTTSHKNANSAIFIWAKFMVKWRRLAWTVWIYGLETHNSNPLDRKFGQFCFSPLHHLVSKNKVNVCNLLTIRTKPNPIPPDHAKMINFVLRKMTIFWILKLWWNEN